eukprot:CAMPEP_0197450110 /NCGR_PEP_ID=MMETSP1175-20131217/24057_1 /TAXON_ID=1003142 /ORGANISM="Triceratium dubium, Strain CCMP147" /LENGTH=171 /DNA_ID=CAMNT_0042982453 /DNA_START=30 /DNA_END=545 /DNA_ORIENTATION=+
MIKTVFVVLAIAAVAHAACDGPGLEGCSSSLSSCAISSGGKPAALCTCRGSYDSCLKNIGCPAATVNAAVASCTESGCTAAQCAASALRQQEVTEVEDIMAPEACDGPTLQQCAASLSTCAVSSGGNQSKLCACRHDYDACLNTAGCPAVTVQAAVHACEDAGCPAATCAV